MRLLSIIQGPIGQVIGIRVRIVFEATFHNQFSSVNIRLEKRQELQREIEHLEYPFRNHPHFINSRTFP
jgi:hypothetical protein